MPVRPRGFNVYCRVSCYRTLHFRFAIRRLSYCHNAKQFFFGIVRAGDLSLSLTRYFRRRSASGCHVTLLRPLLRITQQQQQQSGGKSSYKARPLGEYIRRRRLDVTGIGDHSDSPLTFGTCCSRRISRMQVQCPQPLSHFRFVRFVRRVLTDQQWTMDRLSR